MDLTKGMDDVKELLLSAKEHERQYRWQDAVACYSKAIEHAKEGPANTVGDLRENLGYAQSRHAFQAGDRTEFAKRIKTSHDEYKRAEDAFRGCSDLASQAKAARCRAMADYLGFWLEPDAEGKRRLVDSAWKNARAALESFIELKDFPQLGRTCSDTYLAAVLSYDFEPGVAERTAILTDLTKCVNEAAEHVTEQRQLAENLVQLAGCLQVSTVFLKHTSKEVLDIIKRAQAAWRKARETDAEAALLERTKADLLFGLDWCTPDTFDEPAGSEQLRVTQGEQLVIAEKANDRLAIGNAMSGKSAMLVWDTATIEDPEELIDAIEEIKRVSEEARREFEVISFVSPDFFTGHWASAPSSPWTSGMRTWREMDLAKKRALAQDGLERGRAQLEFAGRTRYPYVIASAHFAMGFLLLEAAKCEQDHKKKQALLHESLEHSAKGLEGEDTYNQSHFWNRGISRCHMAWSGAELGKMENDAGERTRILRSSASRAKEGLDLCEAYLHESLLVTYDMNMLTMLGVLWHNYGGVLRLCWEQSRDKGDLDAACAAFERAAELQTGTGVLSRAAEGVWEAARICDSAGEHDKASDRFERAGKLYREAAQKTKPLRGYFEDYASYMQGWSEIEKAKQFHSRQEPASSREHYRKASEIHASTQKWSFLASNYSAWAEVENGEDLSRKEDSAASVKAFRQAAGLFLESKENLRTQLDRIDCADLKRMAEELIDATDNRRTLCEARAVLESARQLDREGRMAEAADGYGRGAEMLHKIRGRVRSEQDMKEIDLNLTLANAWKAMAKAEAETSPELYQEAAQLFEKSKDLSPGEKAKNLAIGNSRFCRALEAGTRFEDTGEKALHSVASDSLESAARHYVKAGQEKAAEYARASRLLLDAYMQMGSAGKESDHDKKASLYAISEKILEASAASFDKAGQPGKRAQIQKLLERVRKDRELAVSLTQVLRAPDIASAAIAISSPSYEAPVGLDRFEHADVQATMIVKPKDMHVGEDLKLDLELVNAGKGPAQLTKVDGLVPPGFDVQAVPDRYRIEDSYLNMRGRRLSAMKTEDIKVVLRPSAHGTYVLRPRVLYLDESGKYKSFEPEPITITVKELGITGWLKGPEKRPSG